LQPAQLEDEQEEQPLDMECVLPSLDLETPLKQEYCFSTFSELHSGQEMPSSEDPKTSFSNSDSHFVHLNSNIGITTSVNDFSNVNGIVAFLEHQECSKQGTMVILPYLGSPAIPGSQVKDC